MDADCAGDSDFDADLDGYDSDAYAGSDCDDADAAISPSATETFYDGVDTDCDGLSDYDADLDGYDSDAYGGDDCLDSDASTHPDAEDTPHDGLDQNCNGYDGPELDLDSASGGLVALQGYSAAQDLSVGIGNIGDGTLSWAVSADQSWVTADAWNGSGAATVAIGADTAGLATGSHSATVTVEDSDSGDSATVALALTVVETWEGSATTSYVRDAMGQVTSIEEPTGEVITMSYDAMGRVTGMTASGGEATGYTWTDGMPTAISSDDGTLTLGYTREGYPQQVTFPDGGSIVGTYDDAGRLEQLDLPSGDVISYDFSATQGLLPDELDSPLTGAIAYGYDADGRVISRELPDGTLTTVAYDDASGEPDTIVHEDRFGNELLRIEASIDARHFAESVAVTDASGTITTSYSYDEAGRLLEASTSAGDSWVYTYDEGGNMLTRTVDGVTEDRLYDSDDRLLQAGNEVFTYDEAGRLASRTTPDGTTTFAYDPFGRLIEWDDGVDLVTYSYAGDGTRLSRDHDGELTTYYYDRSTILPRLIQAVTDDGVSSSTVTYLWGATGVEAIDVDGTSYGVLRGRLGSSAGLVSGASVELWDYTPFGDPITEPASAPEQATWLAFAGEERDPVTGLIFLRSRYYDPGLARFITPDTAEADPADVASWNRYAYVSNNPVNFVDPAGTIKWQGVIGGVAAVLAGAAMIATGGVVLGVLGALTIGTGKAALVTSLFIPAGADFTPPATPAGWAAWVGQQVSTDPTTDQLIGIAGTLADMIAGGAVNPASYAKLAGVANMSDIISHIAQFNTLTDHLKSFFQDYASWLYNNDRAKWEATFRDNPMFSWMFEDEEAEEEAEPAADPDDERGGVYLNETAQLMGDLTQLTGAFMDPETGQLILYGEDGGYAVDGLDENDLMTALQWLGDSMATSTFVSPGVTIENDLVPIEDPIPPDYDSTYHGVGYYGGIEYTYMGWVAFEADRVLKCLSLGVDNEDPSVTYDWLITAVPGFDFGYEYFIDHYDGTAPSGWVRWWLEPLDMFITLDPTRDAFVFDTATMEVLYEDQDDPTMTWAYADAWTAMLTSDYDDLAVELESWDELRTMAQYVSLAYLLYDQDVAGGLNWDYIDAYEVEEYDTPWWTLEGSMSYEFVYDGTTISQGSRGGALMWDGGEVYTTDTSGVTELLFDDILAARPDDATDSWDFTATDGTTGTAVAISLQDAAVAGDYHRVFADLELPTPGALPLNAWRSYSSVRGTQDRDHGMGAGWHYLPWSLRVSSLIEDHSSYGSAPASATLTDHISGDTEHYVFSAYYSGQAGYLASGSDTLLYYDPLTTLWSIDHHGLELIFSEDGLLLQAIDPAGNTIDYSWTDDELDTATHSSGRVLSYAWSGGALQSVSADSGWSVSYGYDGDGLLSSVTDRGGQDWSYGYADGLLTSIAAPDGTAMASVAYDDWGRMTSAETLGNSYTQDASLLDGTTTISDGAGVAMSFTQNDDGQLESVTDGEGNAIAYGYDTDGHLETVTDALGNVSIATYRSDGTLWTLEDAAGSVTQYFWSYEPAVDDYALYCSQSPDGTQLFYDRDAAGMIDTIYEATFSVDASGNISGMSYSSSSALVESTWDATGELTAWAKGELSAAVTRNTDGLPTTVVHPGGLTETVSYDSYGRVASVESGTGASMELGWDLTHPDLVATVTMGGSLYQSFSYDALGRLEEVEDAAGNLTMIAYGDDGAASEVMAGDGGWVAYDRDGGGRVTMITGSWGMERTRSYDDAGRMEARTRVVSLP